MMSLVIGTIFFIVSVLFIRATLITLGFYKEPVLHAFQQYGEEVGFSPLLDMFLWGGILAYMIFLAFVPSTFLIILGVITGVAMTTFYWRIKANIMNYPTFFLLYPRWYYDIIDRTSREERRKLSYMWLGLPLRTRLLYNTRDDAFEMWVELVVISVA